MLRAPLDACLARVQSREGDPPIDAGAIERIWRSFSDLGDLEKNALEVGDMDPEESRICSLGASRPGSSGCEPAPGVPP